jgi:hypothetical protein
MVESRKRNIINMPDTELLSKFRSKRDFYSYLTDNCKCSLLFNSSLLVQYYLPPIHNINKDFIRSVFREEKKLMKMADIVPVHVPLYSEINVHDVHEMFSNNKEFMMYLPDRMPKGR